MKFFDRFRPYLELKRAIVNLKSGTVFRAVVYQQTGPWLILRQAEILEDRGTAVKGSPPAMDGEVLVMRTDIDFVQVIR